MLEEPQPTRAVAVFYSYAHEDEKLKDELLKHLANIERQELIVSWHDRKITAGREWAGAIDEHINTAGLILLLISPDFMSSGYCNDVELKRAMQRHEAGEARVIPIIIRPVDWKGAPFEKLRMLPVDARPVTRRRNRDDALLEVAQGVREAVEELASRPTLKTPRKPREPIIPRPPVVGFVARRDEQGRDIIGRLKEELAPEKSQLVALWGPGGAGKSTLAAEFVRATQEAFGGRVAWVSALGRSEFSLATLLDELATQLGREDLRKLTPEAKATQVADLVSEAQTLVILDNFETVAEEEQTCCLEFISRNATCPALITTRAFVDRDELTNVQLAAMEPDEAREFLRRLIERTPKSQKFTHLDHDDLIGKCEANPLILQWVVRQIVLSKTPQTALDYLASGEGDAAERVFKRSFNLPQLGDDGRAALLALSLFTPDASREVLSEVAGFGGDLRRLNKAIEKLSALWLVETTAGNERLYLRGLTRELAKSHMSNNKDKDDFRRRFISYFLRHAGAHQKSAPEELNKLETEKDNLLAAMDIAFGMREWGSVMLIRIALGDFLNLRGYWDDAIRSGEQAEAAANEAKNEWGVAFFAVSKAKIRWQRGKNEEVGKTYQEALETFKRLGRETSVASVLYHMGTIAIEQSNMEEARRLYDEGLEIVKRLEDECGVADMTYKIGVILFGKREFEEARIKFEESLAIERKHGRHDGVANNLNGLGAIAHINGNLKEARRLYGEGLDIRTSLGDQQGIAYNLKLLGMIAEKEGDETETVRLFREAASIFEKLGSTEAEKIRRELERVEGGLIEQNARRRKRRPR